MRPNEGEHLPAKSTIMKGAVAVTVFIVALYNALDAFAHTASSNTEDLPGTLQGILDSAQKNNASLYTYPTDLTRNIVPVCVSQPLPFR